MKSLLSMVLLIVTAYIALNVVLVLQLVGLFIRAKEMHGKYKRDDDCRTKGRA